MLYRITLRLLVVLLVLAAVAYTTEPAAISLIAAECRTTQGVRT